MRPGHLKNIATTFANLGIISILIPVVAIITWASQLHTDTPPHFPSLWVFVPIGFAIALGMFAQLIRIRVALEERPANTTDR